MVTVQMGAEEMGQRIARLRDSLARREGKKRLTQKELAARIGASRGTVAEWERGARSPGRDNLMKLAEAFDVSPDVILYGEPHSAGLNQGISRVRRPNDVVDNGYTDDAGAPGFFRTLEGSLAHFRGIAPPGTAQARKKLAWESLTDAAKHFGWPIPDDWYEIPEMIDDGKV